MPTLIDPSDHTNGWGHQIFPDISIDRGSMHAIWWDSRNDPSYSVQRPIGNDANGHVYPSLDAYGASAPASGTAQFPGSVPSDVYQCRHLTATGTASGDTCPRAGGLDQNIYGDATP
jgi:hypothetical protein